MRILREQKKHAKEIEEALLQGIPAGIPTPARIGIAVDIGTTTVAMTVLSLQENRIIGQCSETNEQTTMGADVMMRIMHCQSGQQEKLHRMIVAQIERMAAGLLQEKAEWGDCPGNRICFSVVGNTAMCHLFLNKSVEGLAGFPFKAAYRGNVQCFGKEIGMQKFVDAKVCVLSGIAAHVGSDALAFIGAEQFFQKNRIQLAVDLGTNAEIVLNRRGKLAVCSAAAGPAFEGKGISCGMPARAGAISGVRLSKGNGNILLEYIEGELPRGICGSGLVDTVAELCKCGLLQEDGYLLAREEAEEQGIHPELCEALVCRDGQNAFLLHPGTGSGREAYLKQGDIRNIQLAKGAVQAGILALLQESGTALSELEEIVIGGVLGSSMRPASVLRIGLLPKLPPEKLRFVGNAAGRGAVKILTEEAFLADMERLATQIQHIELANMPEFQKLLVEGMRLSIK